MKTIILIAAIIAMATALPVSNQDIDADTTPGDFTPVEQSEQTTEFIDVEPEQESEQDVAPELESKQDVEPEIELEPESIQDVVAETTTTETNIDSADENREVIETIYIEQDPDYKPAKPWHSRVTESKLVKKTSEKFGQIKEFLSWIE